MKTHMEGSGESRQQAIGKAVALVADLLLGAKVLVSIRVYFLVGEGFDHVEGYDLLYLGSALDHDTNALSRLLKKGGEKAS